MQLFSYWQHPSQLSVWILALNSHPKIKTHETCLAKDKHYWLRSRTKHSPSLLWFHCMREKENEWAYLSAMQISLFEFTIVTTTNTLFWTLYCLSCSCQSHFHWLRLYKRINYHMCLFFAGSGQRNGISFCAQSFATCKKQKICASYSKTEGGSFGEFQWNNNKILSISRPNKS